MKIKKNKENTTKDNSIQIIKMCQGAKISLDNLLISNINIDINNIKYENSYKNWLNNVNFTQHCLNESGWLHIENNKNTEKMLYICKYIENNINITKLSLYNNLLNNNDINLLVKYLNNRKRTLEEVWVHGEHFYCNNSYEKMNNCIYINILHSNLGKVDNSERNIKLKIKLAKKLKEIEENNKKDKKIEKLEKRLNNIEEYLYEQEEEINEQDKKIEELEKRLNNIEEKNEKIENNIKNQRTETDFMSVILLEKIEELTKINKKTIQENDKTMVTKEEFNKMIIRILAEMLVIKENINKIEKINETEYDTLSNMSL
jgi:hypothetical protein